MDLLVTVFTQIHFTFAASIYGSIDAAPLTRGNLIPENAFSFNSCSFVISS